VRDGLITRDQRVSDRRNATAELAALPPSEVELEEQPL
jgi:hypothetical protein